RIEAEGEIRAAHVVVNRLGHADDLEALGTPHVARGAQRAVAAHDDERVQAILLPVLAYACEVGGIFKGVDARSAEDRAAAGQDACDACARERLDVVLDQPAPTVLDAEHLHLFVARAPHDGADDGVQPGAIAPRSQHPYAHAHKNNRSRGSVSRFSLRCFICRAYNRATSRGLSNLMREGAAERVVSAVCYVAQGKHEPLILSIDSTTDVRSVG